MLLNIISQSSSKFIFMYSWSEKYGMLFSELLKVCFINACEWVIHQDKQTTQKWLVLWAMIRKRKKEENTKED